VLLEQCTVDTAIKKHARQAENSRIYVNEDRFANVRIRPILSKVEESVCSRTTKGFLIFVYLTIDL